LSLEEAAADPRSNARQLREPVILPQLGAGGGLSTEEQQVRNYAAFVYWREANSEKIKAQLPKGQQAMVDVQEALEEAWAQLTDAYTAQWRAEAARQARRNQLALAPTLEPSYTYDPTADLIAPPPNWALPAAGGGAGASAGGEVKCHYCDNIYANQDDRDAHERFMHLPFPQLPQGRSPFGLDDAISALQSLSLATDLLY